MKNIEVKVSIDNSKEIIKKLKIIKAKHLGILKQKDTYYFCPSGRLKLREINNKKYELIFYKRPNLKQSKISSYQIVNLDKKGSKELNLLLSQSFGVFVIVNKERDLWIYKNTRIHLDKVENLGNFLELETVVKGNNINKYQKEYSGVFNTLDLSKYTKQRKSYSDLLIENKHK